LELGIWSFRATARLLLRLRGRFASFLSKCLHPFEFLLEPARKIVGAVLEEDNKTESEENEKNEPEKPAKERHGLDGNLLVDAGQRSEPHAKVPV
jgi:hypothetical protein